MADIYCGIDKVPAKKRLGSMKECAEKKQVKYYGIKKIDSKLLASVKKPSKKPAKTRESVYLQFIDVKGKCKKLKNKIDKEKDKDEKKKMEKELNKLMIKLKAKAEEFKEIDEQTKKEKAKAKKSKK